MDSPCIFSLPGPVTEVAAVAVVVCPPSAEIKVSFRLREMDLPCLELLLLLLLSVLEVSFRLREMDSPLNLLSAMCALSRAILNWALSARSSLLTPAGDNTNETCASLPCDGLSRRLELRVFRLDFLSCCSLASSNAPAGADEARFGVPLAVLATAAGVA